MKQGTLVKVASETWSLAMVSGSMADYRLVATSGSITRFGAITWLRRHDDTTTGLMLQLCGYYGAVDAVAVLMLRRNDAGFEPPLQGSEGVEINQPSSAIIRALLTQ